eukprot:12399189-Karenia_brevis.AAC.1
MPMLYRLRTKIRKEHLVRWKSPRDGPWDTAIKGSSALRASLDMHIGAILEGQAILTTYWDMEKLYNKIEI